MKSKILLLALAIAGMSALSGCEIDFRDRDGYPYTYCDDSGCWYCDREGCYPDNGWGSCNSNDDCAAGCYCSNGACEEGGFCSDDQDCGEGMVCDYRASCVPDDQEPPECQVGDGFCCETDSDCLEGCYCDEGSGQCVETGTCESDDDCTEAGQECDESRGTCVPCENDNCEPPVTEPGNCYEAVTCDEAPTTCPNGTLPGVLNGCYTGFCVPENLCPDEPPFECRNATSEAECDAALGCEAVYVGIDCVDPDGNTCTDEAPNCECDHFEYGVCRDRATN